MQISEIIIHRNNQRTRNYVACESVTCDAWPRCVVVARPVARLHAGRAVCWPFARSATASTCYRICVERALLCILLTVSRTPCAVIRRASNSHTVKEEEIPAESRQLRLWRKKLHCRRIKAASAPGVITELSIGVSRGVVGVGTEVNDGGLIHTSTSRTNARECLVAGQH